MTATQFNEMVQSNQLHAVATALDRDPSLSNVTDRTGHRLSALHHAARLGLDDMCELLAAAGANVDKCDHQGETPILLAASAGHHTIVVALLQAGASFNLQRAWRAALNAGHDATAELLFAAWREGQRSG